MVGRLSMRSGSKPRGLVPCCSRPLLVLLLTIILIILVVLVILGDTMLIGTTKMK